MAMATSYGSMANPPFTSKTPLSSKQVSNWIPATISNGNGTGGMFIMARRNPRIGFQVCAVTGDQGSRNVSDVKFPSDYTELLMQAKEAVESALKDGKQLLEIEFPTAGLQSVPGDGEGGNEMTGSMLLIREFCDRFVPAEKVTRTRVFFPEANEVSFARQSAFEGCSLKLDYLTKPSLFEDFGFTTKLKMVDRVKPEDETFLVAYPYFNVNEMHVVEELYKEAVVGTNRKLIIFNGELDRIRSGCILFVYMKILLCVSLWLPSMLTMLFYIVHYGNILNFTSTFLNRRHLVLTTLKNSFPKHFSRSWTQFTIFTISRESKGERFSGATLGLGRSSEKQRLATTSACINKRKCLH